VNEIVSGIDISPTICDLLGAACPDNWHGQPMLPLENYRSKGAFGEAIGKLQHRVTETDRPTHYYQHGDLRISHRSDDNSWALFDLDSDPGERNNVIDSHPQADEMKDKLRSKITWWNIAEEPVFKVENF
jgi:arylsulfatase A-like enzyme